MKHYQKGFKKRNQDIPLLCSKANPHGSWATVPQQMLYCSWSPSLSSPSLSLSLPGCSGIFAWPAASCSSCISLVSSLFGSELASPSGFSCSMGVSFCGSWEGPVAFSTKASALLCFGGRSSFCCCCWEVNMDTQLSPVQYSLFFFSFVIVLFNNDAPQIHFCYLIHPHKHKCADQNNADLHKSS